MRLVIYLAIILLASCMQPSNNSCEIFISGKTDVGVEFLTIGKDTIDVENGMFTDTLQREKNEYNYLKLSSWKWPRIIYLDSHNPINLDFEDKWISLDTDKFNEFLLNKDSILIPYTSRWDMTDEAFRKAWFTEFPVNLERIDGFFEGSKTPQRHIDELKQMEYMLRGHLTANFISFQEKKGLQINRNIYDFVDSIDLNNERLAFHVNNRNFQYYYYYDKLSENTPDSIYPFSVVDTVKKYVLVKDIRNMIIGSAVKSGLYDESVDHDALFRIYEEHIGKLSPEDKIVKLYDQIQLLKPGNKAPDFGNLTDIQGTEISIEDLKGKNILLSAWGTWCPFCKEELPHLKKLMMKFPDKFVSVAVSLDRDAEKWKNYVIENDWQGVHLIDPNRGSLFKENYLISGTNIYFLIDKNGLIKAANVKPSSEALEVLIKNME